MIDAISSNILQHRIDIHSVLAGLPRLFRRKTPSPFVGVNGNRIRYMLALDAVYANNAFQGDSHRAETECWMIFHFKRMEIVHRRRQSKRVRKLREPRLSRPMRLQKRM